MSKVIIIGNGKMSQAIQVLLSQSQGFDLIQVFDSKNVVTLDSLIDLEADYIIDSSVGSVFLDNLDTYLQTRAGIIVVSSGWYQELSTVKAKVAEKGSKLLYSDNFAIGSYVYKQIIKQACQLINGLDFDIALSEKHHVFKKDYPSGVAKKIAQIVVNNLDTKNNWTAQVPDGRVDKETFQISSLRFGTNTIDHDLHIASDYEDITVSHRVRDRKVIAQGVMHGLDYLSKINTGCKSMVDLINWLQKQVPDKPTS